MTAKPKTPAARAAQPLLWCRACQARHLPPIPQPYRCRGCGFIGWVDPCGACRSPILATTPTTSTTA